MPETLQYLTKNLTQLPDTEAVRRNGNSYALDASGHIIALSASGTQVKSLLLDDSAAALEHLYLNDNELLESVNITVALPRLRHLYLSRCALTSFELPAGCAALEQIYLQSNQLTTLEIKGDCPSLVLLDAAQNQLTGFVLPAGFSNLAYLYLNHNQLKSLEFPELPALNILHLAKNQLTKIPVGNYPQLETLYLSDNPLEDYSEVQIKGDESGNAETIIGMLRATAQSGETTNYRAKLILVGNGRVGKTSLLNRLSGLPFNEDEIYTAGIVIRRLTKNDLKDVSFPELDLRVWDFGGQEIYYATHQFFLSEESAYLYAWTSRAIAENNRKKDKKQAPVAYDQIWREHGNWLSNIRMHGEKSPILVVKTHAFDCPDVLPFDQLKTAYDLDLPPVDFDAASKEEKFLTRLKAELTKAVNALPLLGKNIPVSYNNVIEAIESRKKNGDKEISRTAFYEMVVTPQNKLTDKDMDSLLSYLIESGEIIYFPKSEKLKERIFISPDHLLKKVYKLLESNDLLNVKKGTFDQAFAQSEFGWADWEGMLELLINFELIYEKKTPGEYVAPQYLPSLRDADPSVQNAFAIFKKSNALRLAIRYPDFLPENAMVNVLCKYGPYEMESAFRNAIQFWKEGAGEACFIECDEQAKSISVFTSPTEGADAQVREIFNQFIALSKKATVHFSIDGLRWMEVDMAKKALEKGKDISLVGGDWLEDKNEVAFLFGIHGKRETKVDAGSPSPVTTDASKTIPGDENTHQTTVAYLKTLVERNELDNAIDKVKHITKDTDFENAALLLSTRLTNNRTAIIKGTSTKEEIRADQNTIGEALLTFLDQLTEEGLI